MGIKESGLQFVIDLENAKDTVITTRADMMEGFESLTHRINAVANDLKEFRAEVRTELTSIKTDVTELKTDVTELKSDVAGVKAELKDLKTVQTTFNTEAMEILIDLQRRMSA